MIVVRDIFRLKFGKSKEATVLWKQAMMALQKTGYGARGVRLLTDMAGPDYYTLILESSHDSLAQWEEAARSEKVNAQWKELYQQIIPLTESGHREILSVIE